MGVIDDISISAAKDLRRAILKVSIDLEVADSEYDVVVAISNLENAIEEAQQSL